MVCKCSCHSVGYFQGSFEYFDYFISVIICVSYCFSVMSALSCQQLHHVFRSVYNILASVLDSGFDMCVCLCLFQSEQIGTSLNNAIPGK